MKAIGLWKQILIALVVSLAIWLLFAWPLPRYVGSGISSASFNVEKGSVRAMIPGDHLQFLYQFWLTADTLKGHTPPFHNLYEFNVGNDTDRKFRGTYYVPFSLFYTAGALIGGRAFGYNFVQIVTLWIAFFFTWLLVRRYNRDDWLSALTAVIGIAFPYLWITMLDGSPTGLAMMWIPIILWALDVLMAERKMWAGAVAGIGICLAECDTHVFFFIVLAAPFWCLFGFLFHFPGRWPSRADMFATLRASLLLVLFLGVAFWEAWHIRHGIQQTTLASHGRGLSEIMASSPTTSGIYRLVETGDSRRIYLGGYLLVLLVAGLGRCLWNAVRRKNAPDIPLTVVLLLCLAVGSVIFLSTGPRNPFGPVVWKAVMKVIPPYGVIRQPHKIYCLMPTLLALTAGVLLPCLLSGFSKRARYAVFALLMGALVFDYSRRISPTVCLLTKEQGAFEAIADDARTTGNPKPILLSLPLWPGDSHYDSLNEYYVSLYRLRMVNGYGGSVKKWFRDDIVLPFESLNVGGISDNQLDSLQKRGVGYLALHEDCFPEKVSPFPVGHTLQALLNHPRLRCIGKDAAVWAFKILSADRAETGREKAAFMKYGFPAKRREFERCELIGAARRGEIPPSEGGGGYVALLGAGATVRLPDTFTTLEPALSWLVRVRGHGGASVLSVVDGVTNALVGLDVDSANWSWKKIPMPSLSDARVVGALFSWERGSVDLDSASLIAGTWGSPAPGESIDLPAACFFHNGYTTRDFRHVVLRKDYDSAGIVFQGPRLPLEEGRYTAELILESDAPVGTELGRFDVRWRGDQERSWVPVKAGSPVTTAFDQKSNRPVLAVFDFFRVADVKIRQVLLTRQE